MSKHRGAGAVVAGLPMPAAEAAGGVGISAGSLAMGLCDTGRGHRGSEGVKPSTFNVTLPAARLGEGDKTITITTTGGSWMVHDALRRLP
ncbi:hypothetical protein [Nonomuraea sediminis]|uniref:hypothetical protein n=1 Tax=Nonomuraea sediminis TaxID=2835864 RepID=UPI001BDD5D6A|nr:hypothetical protein [Nonomuraea sediminis]